MLSQAAVFPTRLGWLAMVGRGARLQRLSFGHRSEAAALRAVLAHFPEGARLGVWNAALAARLKAYALGAVDDFRDIEVDQSGLSDFARCVLAHCRSIEYGATLSYRELAARADAPGAARAVGNVMAANRCPLVVPCHRVVASGMRLGGFSAPGGVKVKQQLLALETANSGLLVVG